ncbi:MAG: alpha/beta hydrolase [Clostridia bacterium]|nr:alpha/beta hydrolase [Clostridia bacterium]
MKKVKVVLSVVLSVLLVVLTVSPAFATDEKCDCGTAPIVQVRGIGETLYDGEGNEVFSAENIIKGILPAIPNLTYYLATGDVDVLVDGVKQAVMDIFAPVSYDNNLNRDTVVTVEGYTSDPVETYVDLNEDYPSSEYTLSQAVYNELGEGHSYLFIYDWTANPFDIAEDLNEFIQEVKEKSGHDKVSICAESMGGCMTNTYLALYGYDDVYNLVMSNSAFNGLEMVGQLFIGNPQIDGEALAGMIVQSIYGSAEYASLIPYIPIFEQLALFANDLFEQAGDRIYEEVLIPIFGYLPSFWCLVPEYHFEEAMEKMLPGAGPELIAFVNEYYEKVVSKTDERVAELVESEDVNYFCTSNYNKYIAPVTVSAKWNSDGVIETYNTSGFATVADLGTTLGVDYVQAVDTGRNMISPDNVVDASTCQAPMMTWFTKNWGHIAYNHDDGTCDFYIWLLTAKEQYTIDSNPQYPQFMYYNTEIPMLMPYICGSGDVSGDGRVTAFDATLILKASAGMICFPTENLSEADVNCDGVITAADARIVLKKASEI